VAGLFSSGNSGESIKPSELERRLAVDKAKTKEHLAQADRNLEKIRDLIRRQRDRLEELARGGLKTQMAERSLRNSEELEEIMERSRHLIREELGRISARERLRRASSVNPPSAAPRSGGNFATGV
jgi:hypothetical protein